MLYKFETNEDVETTTFEEEMQKQLLIEALSQQKAEVFENVVFEGNKRYYIEDLTKRDYILENTTPYQNRIEGVCIEEKSFLNYYYQKKQTSYLTYIISDVSGQKQQ